MMQPLLSPALERFADAAQAKVALRETMLARRAAVSERERNNSDALLCARLAEHAAYRAARTVFCFVGVRDEIDTLSFLQKVLNDEKILCAPFCVPGQKGVMHAKRITDLAQLVPGMRGIPEPPESAPTVPPGDIDFALLPCVAADAAGGRLGYGGGYYDRYLPQLSSACTVLLPCRAALLLPVGSVPQEPHDVRVRRIVTEQGELQGEFLP